MPLPNPELAQAIVEQNVAFHEAQARLYDLSHPELTNLYQRVMLRRDLRRVRELLSDVERPLAVDVGAGTGRLSLALARAGFEVIALDNSPAMLEVLRGRYERLREPKGALRTVVAGAEELSEGLLDGEQPHLIACSSVLHHLPDYLQVLRQACRLLPAGGCLYVAHEPLPAQVESKTLSMRLVGLLDTLLRTPQQLYKNAVRARMKLPKPPPAPLMDYHDRQGLDVAAMRGLLAEEGLEIVFERRYKDRKMAVMTVLDTYVLKTPNWKFALLGRKKG